MAKIIFSDGSRQWAHELDDLRERWSIRKESKTNDEWMPVSLFSVDIQSKDKHDLILLHASLSELARDIDLEISRAKSKAFITGVYSDPEWFSNTISARKSISIHQQIIQLELSKRPRESRAKSKRKERYKDLPNAFISIAKQKLTKQEFDSIMYEAKRTIGDTTKNDSE